MGIDKLTNEQLHELRSSNRAEGWPEIPKDTPKKFVVSIIESRARKLGWLDAEGKIADELGDEIRRQKAARLATTL